MSRMKPLAPILAFALAACATTSDAPREGPVALGQTAYVGGPLVTPVAVVEDSRCPMNARCIWAGRLVVRVAIRGHSGGGSWTMRRDLTLGTPHPVADGALTLVAATPGRMAGTELRSADYRFTFDFQGGI